LTLLDKTLGGELRASDRLHGTVFCDGKAVISAEVAGILERLGSNAESWWSRIEKLSNGRLLGRFFAVNRQRLRDVARRLGVHHLANLGGCLAR
jgi:hypothetical protein